MISSRTRYVLLFSTACLAVILANFFLSLFFMNAIFPPSPASTKSTREVADRLATQRLGTYAELPAIARQLGLKFAREMGGHVDTLNRISERDVTMIGWVADPEGDATPTELLVFVGGALAARTKTSGERADVQQAMNLYFGSEKNVVFQFTFACAAGAQPVMVAVGKEGRYFGLVTPLCP
jgi:hypothetical protein